MDQTLSHNEIDALITAAEQGNFEKNQEDLKEDDFKKSSKTIDKIVKKYDLTNKDRVIRGRMPTLDLIYERFVRLFRMSLSNSLRKIAAINIVSTDFLNFGEFISTLPIPSCICIMRSENLRGAAIFVFESKLVYSLVDSFFGGTDQPYMKIDAKEFTRIELEIIKKVIELAIKDLDDAWAPVYKLDISFVRIEVNPHFVGVVLPSDTVISTLFEVELESATGTIVLMMPYSTIEPIKEVLNSSFRTEVGQGDKEWVDQLQEHIRNTFVNLCINLGFADITVGDLVNLNVGDIVPLAQDVDGELEVLIEGVPKLKCFFGDSRGNRAVQVTKIIND